MEMGVRDDEDFCRGPGSRRGFPTKPLMLCFWDDIERRSRYRILITSILLESKKIYLKYTMLAEKDTPAFFWYWPCGGLGHVSSRSDRTRSPIS